MDDEKERQDCRVSCELFLEGGQLGIFKHYQELITEDGVHISALIVWLEVFLVFLSCTRTIWRCPKMVRTGTF